MPSSNTSTPTWRTARSRAPLPQLAVSLLSHRPPNTHFECCMNLVGGPCPLRSPDTSTSYRVDVCVPSSLVQAPPSSGSFPEVDRGSLYLPGFLWGVGVWSGMGRTNPPPLSLSAFLFFNKAGSKKKSSACGRERRRGQEPWEPLPSIRLSRAVFFQGRPLERVSEPALHTDASPLSHAQPAWGSWYWGRRHLFFSH